MKFDVNIPVRIFSGKGCLKQNANRLILGRRAVIVCGRHGARASGALDDVSSLLEAAGTDYMIFDKATENPPVEICHEGGRAASAFRADFIIGIGGGSALDSAKAIAAFAANPGIEPLDIYDPEKLVNPSLPLVLIPTTAGTGSEANAYSVLTLPDGKRKRTFTSEMSWAKYAFLDPDYTLSLPKSYTVSCALDAFAHGIESYLSPKATGLSSALALYAMKLIWNVLSYRPENFTYEMHEDLLYASCAAGIAISVTGSGFPHPLGYPITLLDGIPHGAACAVFEGDYIRYNQKTETGARKINEIASYLGTTPETMAVLLPELSGVKLEFTPSQIEERIELVCNAKNYVNSPYVITKDEMYEIYNRHFLAR
ncbi:MAG: iron-containing alcohol dehydrogenase [Clostridiales bacterium]|nr:iron-containing alcohol dehydrogenase [Clostridiales bacterium]